MRLKNVSFEVWLSNESHSQKAFNQRWLRELYPWPVFAQIDCDESLVGVAQEIRHQDVDYTATLRQATLQPRGTWLYEIHLSTEGLGWHDRGFDDVFVMCGTRDGRFVTLFHDKKDPVPLVNSVRVVTAKLTPSHSSTDRT